MGGVQGQLRVHMTAAAERFPGNCDSCDMSRNMFSAGTDCETWVPFLRFDSEPYAMHDRDAAFYGKAYIMHGSFVEHDLFISFDNQFFGINDEEAAAIAPAQRWILEVGYECLHNGGWDRISLMGKRIGTFMGDSGSEWNEVYWEQNKYILGNNLGAITVTRISYLLGLTGPSVSVDTACSASLVAANSAAHWMRSATFQRNGKDIRSLPQTISMQQYAICQGILCINHPGGWIGECAATMLSFRGRCFTFDSSADGFIRGEGSCCGFLEAKHDDLADAGSQSLAVLMASSTNQDGRSASLTAPHGPSQQECIRISLREAGLIASEVWGTECHGTGTALGDPIEVGANKGIMQYNRDEKPYFHCTAKAHVGHEEANAGICGLLKVMIMMNAGFVTPNPHLRSLNPHLDVAAYPVYFNNELSQIRSNGICFGVSSFGFGGTNSRADCWVNPEKGAFRSGTRVVLSKEEASMWVNQLIDNVGTSEEFAGFVWDHKDGH